MVRPPVPQWWLPWWPKPLWLAQPSWVQPLPVLLRWWVQWLAPVPLWLVLWQVQVLLQVLAQPLQALPWWVQRLQALVQPWRSQFPLQERVQRARAQLLLVRRCWERLLGQWLGPPWQALRWWLVQRWPVQRWLLGQRPEQLWWALWWLVPQRWVQLVQVPW